MLVFAGFIAPYLIAIAVLPQMLRGGRSAQFAAAAACLLIVSTPWLVPADAALLRFLASIAAAILAIKVMDAARDVQQGRAPAWRAYINSLANPFIHVRRCLPHEPQPPQRQNLLTVLAASAACAIATALLVALFGMDWSDVPFVVQHMSKVAALMLAIAYALTAAAALWRLGGGQARDFMDRPFAACTPADFWRRYNRSVHQFFLQDVFNGRRSRKAPLRTMVLVFVLSAILHEYIFLAAVGQVQGHQTAFLVVGAVLLQHPRRCPFLRTRPAALVALTLDSRQGTVLAVNLPCAKLDPRPHAQPTAMHMQELRQASFLTWLLFAAATAVAAPDHACRQVGEVKAAPPLIPESSRIDECSSFAGGPDAASFGKNWCDHAAKVAFGPNDVPPKVTKLDSCPKGAIALCTAQVPNSSVVVSRYFYIADRGAGGIDGLRRSCEGRKRKDPTAVFTVLQ